MHFEINLLLVFLHSTLTHASMSDRANFESVKKRLEEYYLQGPIYFNEENKENFSPHNTYLQHFKQDLITYFRKHQPVLPLLMRDWITTVSAQEFYHVLRQCNLDGRFYVFQITTISNLCVKCNTQREEEKYFAFDASANVDLHNFVQNINSYCLFCKQPSYFILFNDLNCSSYGLT